MVEMVLANERCVASRGVDRDRSSRAAKASGEAARRAPVKIFVVLFAFAASAVAGAGIAPARAADAVSFKGKTMTVIVGTSPGGTTDFLTRLMTNYLVKYLPGVPTGVVQDRPGAHSLAALNYFSQGVKPDGLTLGAGSITELDPESYRVPESRYDPSKLSMIGAVEIGGGVIAIRNQALLRLTNKAEEPVEMASTAGYPHVTMLMAAWGREYLGWNVKWVPGYPSDAASLILALVRGEVDMTAFSATTLTPTLLDKSKYTILYQTGSASGTRPSALSTIAGTPIFRSAMDSRIQDPLARKALDYWCDSSSVAVWLALPPGTPPDVVATYRAAFEKTMKDPDFVAHGTTFSKDFVPVSADRITTVVKDFAGVSPQVLEFMPHMLRAQGLKLE
jgi:tripartite-type tricarboxylate transporter receptor subunit TctC